MEAPRRRRPHPVARPRRGRAPASGLRGDAPRCHLVPGHARQARLRRPAERLARRGDRARPLGIPDEVPAGALRRHAGRRDRGVARRPRQSVIAWRAALAGAGLLAIGCAVDPVSSPPSAVATLDRELAAIAADPARPLASLSVLAIRHGEVVYSRQFGRRHIDPDKPADAATLYRIASISKLVTTIGALRLVDEGKLSLDTDIGGYLGYRVPHPQFPPISGPPRIFPSPTPALRHGARYYLGARSSPQSLFPPPRA